MDESKNYENFQKQRRNLILFSLAVIFYEVGNLKILGFNIISVKGTFDPSVVNPFLHGILIYFIWRYFVAFKAILAIAYTKTTYKDLIYKGSYKDATKCVERKFIKKNDIKNEEEIRNVSASITYVKPKTHTDTINKSYSFTISPNPKNYRTANLTIKGMRLNIIKTKVIIIIFLTTNLFLEFYFPFVLASFALLESFDQHVTAPFIWLLNW